MFHQPDWQSGWSFYSIILYLEFQVWRGAPLGKSFDKFTIIQLKV
jgi:hypothetical protein